VDLLLSLHNETVLDEFPNENSGVGLTNLLKLVGIHPYSLATTLQDSCSQSLLTFKAHHNFQLINISKNITFPPEKPKISS
jgi:hypothetical protein